MTDKMTEDKKVFELIKIGKFEDIPSESWKNRDVVLKAIEVSADVSLANDPDLSIDKINKL